MNSFTKKVIAAVKAIRRGKTASYKEIARAAGNSKAARAVGRILGSYDPRKYNISCHRVIRSDGRLGGYRWGIAKKRKLLESEIKTL